MYSHSKKVGSLGRYGPRIGRKLRDEIKKIEDISKKNECPVCGRKVKRKAAGIYECKSCNKSFTGGAYIATKKTKSKTMGVEEPEKSDEIK